MRIFFTGGGTGGHLYPALAIARAVVALRPHVTPHFIGAQRGIERDILPTTEFPFTLLPVHPLYRAAPWRNWQTVMGLAGGWRRVSALAHDASPRLVVATGGYASAATLAWALAHRVPYVLQEQNAHVGQTNRWFSRWATEVHVGFPEAVAGVSASARQRTFDLGNPIQPPPEPRPDRATARAQWGFGRDVHTVVLAFGGSQGSAALNRLVEGWVRLGVPEGVGVIWGTGRAHYERHAALVADRVRVQAYLNPIVEAYAAADLAVSRAGAMTTAELSAWGIPMFLVPLPTAAADHQTINARSLAAAGAATWVAEKDAHPADLTTFVSRLVGDTAAREAARHAARRRGRPAAAVAIAERLIGLLDRTTAVRA